MLAFPRLMIGCIVTIYITSRRGNFSHSPTMTCSRHVANVIEMEKQEVVEHLGWGMYGLSTLLVVYSRDSNYLLVTLSSRHRQRTRPRIEHHHLSFTSQQRLARLQRCAVHERARLRQGLVVFKRGTSTWIDMYTGTSNLITCSSARFLKKTPFLRIMLALCERPARTVWNTRCARGLIVGGEGPDETRYVEVD